MSFILEVSIGLSPWIDFTHREKQFTRVCTIHSNPSLAPLCNPNSLFTWVRDFIHSLNTWSPVIYNIIIDNGEFFVSPPPMGSLPWKSSRSTKLCTGEVTRGRTGGIAWKMEGFVTACPRVPFVDSLVQVVVSKIFYFHPYLGKISNLTGRFPI